MNLSWAYAQETGKYKTGRKTRCLEHEQCPNLYRVEDFRVSGNGDKLLENMRECAWYLVRQDIKFKESSTLQFGEERGARDKKSGPEFRSLTSCLKIKKKKKVPKQQF